MKNFYDFSEPFYVFYLNIKFIEGKYMQQVNGTRKETEM